MTTPGFLATWQRGRIDKAGARRSMAAAAGVPADFAYDGRLMTPAEFLTYVKAAPIAWATRGATVHHTYSPNEATWRKYGGWAYWGPQMARYYRNTRGWHCGPHAFISYEGISIFTPLGETGIHAGAEANRTTIGMEIVGDFMAALPEGQTLENATWAYAAVLWRLGKDAASLYPHRYWMATQCPGDALYRDFRWFRCLVDARIEAIARGDAP